MATIVNGYLLGYALVSYCKSGEETVVKTSLLSKDDLPETGIAEIIENHPEYGPIFSLRTPVGVTVEELYELVTDKNVLNFMDDVLWHMARTNSFHSWTYCSEYFQEIRDRNAA